MFVIGIFPNGNSSEVHFLQAGGNVLVLEKIKALSDPRKKVTASF